MMRLRAQRAVAEDNLEADIAQRYQGENLRIQNELRKTYQYAATEFDSQFMAVVVFQTRAQLFAFLDGVGWDREQGERFISGTALAKHLNDKYGAEIQLPLGPKWKPRKTARPEFAALARELDER